MLAAGAGEELKPLDPDPARLQVDGLARAGKVVGAFSSDLERGKGRRYLVDIAGEVHQGGPDRLVAWPRGAGVDDLAFGVVGRAGFAEAKREAVFLGTLHDEGHRLGRLSQGNRQHAARQRVERTAMPGLLG